MSKIPGMQCVELIPGANYYVVPELLQPEPIDNDCEVQVFRLNPDGSKGELLRIEPAFPEGWHHPQQFREKGFQKKKEDKAKMARYYWKALWPQAQELLAQGLSTAKVAEKLGIDAPALRCKIDRERRKKERQKRIVAEEKQAKPRPSTDELQRLWDKYDGKINPIAKEWMRVREEG